MASDHRTTIGGEHVARAEPHVFGHVELGFEPRVLAHAHLVAVDPHVQHAVGRADVQHDASIPSTRRAP